MRWKEPKFNDRRIITKFLFCPKKIKGETRWLEKASFKQKFYVEREWGNDGYCDYGGYWINEEWVDYKKE